MAALPPVVLALLLAGAAPLIAAPPLLSPQGPPGWATDGVGNLTIDATTYPEFAAPSVWPQFCATFKNVSPQTISVWDTAPYVVLDRDGNVAVAPVPDHNRNDIVPGHHFFDCYDIMTNNTAYPCSDATVGCALGKASFLPPGDYTLVWTYHAGATVSTLQVPFRIAGPVG